MPRNSKYHYNSIHRKIHITEDLLKRFWEKVRKSKGCWNWIAYKNKQGYGRFGLKAGECINAHRVSWVIHNGNIPDNYFICHKCYNPSCVNPDHLFCGTRQDNMNDMMIKKRARHFKKNNYYGVVEEKRYDGSQRKNRWRSFIVINEKVKKLGAHTSILEAARNYDRIAYMKYGIKDKLNFPQEYDFK
jgi:HNH endonuclease